MPIEPYEPSPQNSDFHAVVSIELGELIEGKWVDWTQDEWKWDFYSEEQYKRVCDKFNARYYHREIGILPPGNWKMEVIRKFNEIMPKYKPLYKALEDGQDILQTSSQYGKNRTIFSDFPATQLKTENQDYASNATDTQNEIIFDGDWLEKVKEIQNYNDIDVMIINELESMFSSLFSVSLNIY